VQFLDSFTRFSGIGLLAILAVLAVREIHTWRSARYLLAACVSLIALFLTMAPQALGLSVTAQSISGILAIPHLICVWLFALSLFEQDFKIQPWHWLVGSIYCAPLLWIELNGVAAVATATPWVLHMATIFSLALMGHLVFATLRGRTNDLLEKRRSARIYFVLVVVFVAVVTALADPLTINRADIDRGTIKTLAIWPAIVWGCLWMFAIDRNAIHFRFRTDPVAIPDERDSELLQKLGKLMGEQAAFKDPDLTIVTLASRLAVTQHRLRKLINQTLGYQNFNEYLNYYRVNAVTAAFEDPKLNHLPILTIAMDSGFKSLSPFNKVFRGIFEMTPSEYRRQIRDHGKLCAREQKGEQLRHL
jgi:AraC-like DNA-binding protein